MAGRQGARPFVTHLPRLPLVVRAFSPEVACMLPSSLSNDRLSMCKTLGPKQPRMPHRALIVAVLLILLLGAWYLTPAVLQASCSQDTMEGRSRGSAVDGHLCPDDGVLQEGRDHVVCVYPDRVVKVVRSCSSSSGVAQRRPHPRGRENPSLTSPSDTPSPQPSP